MMTQFSWKDLDLNDEDIQLVKTLIENEKNPKNELEFHKIEKQIIETLDIDCSKTNKMRCKVIDHEREIEYLFNVLLTKRSDKFNIGLFSLEYQKFLLRFDFGDTLRHKNNYGTENEYMVFGPHIHVFDLPDKRSEKNVIPIESVESFKNLYHIADIFDKFVKATNITRRCR